MSIIKIEKHTKNFVIMDKTSLRDNRLSWKSKGVLSYLLSLPNNWSIKISEVMKHSTDGKASLLSGLKELKKYGYCTLIESRNPDGTIKEYDYIVREIPLTENPLADNQLTDNQLLISNNNILNNELIEELNETDVSLLSKTKRRKSSARNIFNKKKPKKKKIFHPNSLGGKLAQFLLDKIEEIDPSFTTPDLGSWECTFSGMIYVQGYPFEEIKDVITFIFKDNFWKTKVVNPFIIKAKYSMLKIQMLNPTKKHQTEEEKKDIFEEAKKKFGGKIF